MQFSGELKSVAAGASPASVRRIAYMEGALSAHEISALSSIFPNMVLETIGQAWPERPASEVEILILGLEASSAQMVEKAVGFLRTCPSRLQVLIALRNADVTTSRTLTRAGAADVIPVPSSEAAWAVSIERLISRDEASRDPGGKRGQVVAMLKAGGGVGATSLGVQAAYLLAARAQGEAKVCYADLDLQFGTAALYFDLSEVLTVTDCLAVGEILQETQFGVALAAHKTGVRVLGAPRDMTPIDVLTPPLTEALMSGLRRDFALTILDLPSIWTAWTDRALQLADRIVLVTNLTVAHIHLVRRQLTVLSLQNLDRLPLTLVCNAVTGEQQDKLSIKAAERALGRSFDVVIPEDAKAMGVASNQGLPLSEIRRGTKLEKQISHLADRMAMDSLVAPQMRR